MRSRNTRSDEIARAGQLAVLDGVDELRPERSRGRDLLQAGGEERQRLGANGLGIDRLQAVHHALADAARRHVDHPPQAHVVVRVDDELEVGERVLDFLALVEADAADDLVGNALAHQRVFDGSRLRVDPVEHGDRAVDVLGARLLQRADDEVGFLELVVAAVGDDARTALAVGPQPLVLAVAVLADDGAGGVEDDLRRAVVLLQPDGCGLREVALEVEDVAEVGAAPLVDRLIRIADDGEVAVDFGQAANQHVLRPVRVLVLVDHDVAELARVELARLLRGLEELDRLEQQVVEVEGVAVAERGDVALEDLRDLLVPDVVGAAEGVGALHAVAQVADARRAPAAAGRTCRRCRALSRSA